MKHDYCGKAFFTPLTLGSQVILLLFLFSNISHIHVRKAAAD